MNKISIKLLMVVSIVSAVNLNPSYCMEYKNELKQDLHSDVSFKEIKEKYNKADAEKQKQIEKFYKALFGNDCDDFKKILYYDTEELHAIESMLKNSDNTMKYLKSLNQKSLDRLLEITNSLKYKCSKKCSDIRCFHSIVNCINNNINFIKLMPSLNMDVSFCNIWEKYYYGGVLSFLDVNRSKIIKAQIEQCCNYLFGNEGKNLLTILSCHNYINWEIQCIGDLLREDYAKIYFLKLLNNKNNTSLLHKVSDVVRNKVSIITESKKHDNYDVAEVISILETILFNVKTIN